ncbi:aminoglycoside phosphotransferase (APT) family kinase protein [Actinomycetospora succinea]|uniref:Aminoglycoside phosphotransferase (APT) family kinase protein n=1 Tax=Actinomycetospora succinea TaxID=663603 RepID=A0A4R6VL23_9PSEU|nr:phosphotransferase [Actinomycetospora succinea]TDQ62635.1 aminoglycoside phosphotransferase (APT) family kinase protein [Actinomycetospora succinea]
MSRVPLGSGWDSDAVLVDGRWVERTARRPAAGAGLEREVRLLPWLARRLPVAVPEPRLVGRSPVTVRHALLRGEALDAPRPAQGATLGTFLRALHDVSLEDAVARGLPGPATTRGWRDRAFARFEAEVVPRLADPVALRERLDRLRDAPAAVVVHGDLRPEHVLIEGGRITGVLDWSDARAGDPAKDLVWPLLETPPDVAAAVTAAYGADLTDRARDWRAVGPCYAVAHGLDTGDAALVHASLERLAAG